MAKDKKKAKGAPTNNTGRPTGTYNSYATSGYGTPYGGYGAGGGSYGRNPYGAYGTTGAPPANGANVTNVNNSTAQGNTKVEKVDLASTGKSKRKQKKIAKKAAKFNEADLRCYPMTVGGWIGTFILLAIPLINIICGICWFFGVGNKSRTSWIRSYVVIVLLIVLILGIILGSGYAVFSNKAKQEGYTGFNGTIYYLACQVVDMLEEPLGGPEATQEIKQMLAEKLGLASPQNPDGGTENGGTVEGGGTIEGGSGIDEGGNEYIEGNEPFEQVA